MLCVRLVSVWYSTAAHANVWTSYDTDERKAKSKPQWKNDWTGEDKLSLFVTLLSISDRDLLVALKCSFYRTLTGNRMGHLPRLTTGSKPTATPWT